MGNGKLEFRKAKIGDEKLILHFIKELAEYEHMIDDVEATEEIVKEWVFEKKKADVIFAVVDGKEVGYILYFYNFSTFTGRAGIYIEDAYVEKSERSKGYGIALFKEVAKICRDENLGRLEWQCLDWNKPSIDFYLSLGAEPMKGWTQYRLDRNGIANLAKQ